MDNANQELNEILKELEELHSDKDKVKNKTIDKQIEENEKRVKSDDFQGLETHKEIINKQIVDELEFKKKAKIWSIKTFLVISLIIIINLILILYWNPGHMDYKVIVVIVTATFANLFAIITLIFKYVFSPTKDMLDYNANIYDRDN